MTSKYFDFDSFNKNILQPFEDRLNRRKVPEKEKQLGINTMKLRYPISEMLKPLYTNKSMKDIQEMANLMTGEMANILLIIGYEKDEDYRIDITRGLFDSMMNHLETNRKLCEENKKLRNELETYKSQQAISKTSSKQKKRVSKLTEQIEALEKEIVTYKDQISHYEEQIKEFQAESPKIIEKEIIKEVPVIEYKEVKIEVPIYITIIPSPVIKYEVKEIIKEIPKKNIRKRKCPEKPLNKWQLYVKENYHRMADLIGSNRLCDVIGSLAEEYNAEKEIEKNRISKA